MTEPEHQESDEERRRRAKEAAWDAMDEHLFRMDMPVQSGGHLWMPGRLGRGQKPDLKLGELEAKLREMERKREENRYRPRASRWWHAIWPFGR